MNSRGIAAGLCGLFLVIGVYDALRPKAASRETIPAAQADSDSPRSDEAVRPAPVERGGGDEVTPPAWNVVEDAPPFMAPRATAPRTIARGDLSRRVGALIGNKVPRGVGVGVAVRSVTTGETLFEYDADKPLIVASNAKLMTSAAILTQVGAAATLDTAVYARGGLGGGVLRGDLVIRAGGDPDILDAPVSLLDRLLGVALEDAGLREIQGDVIVDDRCFDRRYVGPEWDPAKLHDKHWAPVAGFSMFENCVGIEVRPADEVGARATITVTPDLPLLRPEASLVTGNAGAKNVIVPSAPVEPGRFSVRGETPLGSTPGPVLAPVLAPPDTWARALVEALRERGVVIGGEARLADAPVDVSDLTHLGTVSTPLSMILARMNKHSINPVAEHLFKRAGFELRGVGTFETGGAAVMKALVRLGVDPAGAASSDGSGLSRGNRYTARQFVGVLAGLYRSDARDVFVDSLAVAGEDGTLDDRIREADYRGRVRAKSGYIYGVSTLSGYAQADSGEVLAFSVLTNGGVTAEMKEVQHDVARLLVDIEPPEGLR